MSEDEKTQGEWYARRVVMYGEFLHYSLEREGSNVAIAQVFTAEEAQQIVTAVNNHEALVEAANIIITDAENAIKKSSVYGTPDYSVSTSTYYKGRSEVAKQLLTQIETNTNTKKDGNDE